MKEIYDFPGEVLTVLDSWQNKKGDLFKRDKASEDHLVRFVHSKENSPFFFTLKNFRITNGDVHFFITHSPSSKLDTGIAQTWVSHKNAEGILGAWVSFLAPYSQYRNPHREDDPLLKQYQENIYNDFEFINDEDESSAFDYQTQYRLDYILDHFHSKLEMLPESEKTEDVLEIQKEIIALRENQTRLPKKEVRKQFSKIIAMLQKQGVKMLREFFDEAKKTVYKRILTGQIVDDFNGLLNKVNDAL
ncbi:hypothetical protein [Polluticoccus soli]|uniref:hypothetical protein n=1 Tax=Polluticoccus soli TaxID=3034150 RepID=UPI0023E2A1EA|nr:hypothetical protein [Flavipsychrobacter sp. JY13-12]